MHKNYNTVCHPPPPASPTSEERSTRCGETWLEICRNVASLARQIYTGYFIKEVRQWDDLLLARSSNSDLDLARPGLTEEEAWLPLLTVLVAGGRLGRQALSSFSVLTGAD